MPSIMPDGATTSAPARAWLTACSARSGSVASLSTSNRPPRLAQGTAMAVVGVLAEADVGDDQQVRGCRLISRTASWTMPVVVERGRTRGVLVGGDAEEEHGRGSSSTTSATTSPRRSSES